MKEFRNEISSLGTEVTLRMTKTVAETLLLHMRSDSHREQMAFALARHAKTATGTLVTINEVILPDQDNLEKQTVASVCPTQDFQSHVYRSAYQSKSTIVEFHTHPGTGVPHFSGIDDAHARPNAKYIAEKFPDPTTLLMIVGNSRFDAFRGIIYDRHREQFRQIERLEVLGRPMNVWPIGDECPYHSHEAGDLFDRQKRIPGWNQELLELQRIGIVGVGGNGALLLQTILGIGAGRRGFIAIADHDLVEQSNLPRIPYAYADHINAPKVGVATHYAGCKSPSTPLYGFPCRFNQQAVRERMTMATILFYCGDNDGGRKEINEFAVRYGIPLIDLGADVQVSDDKVVAGGQVRLVLPGENACLVCCRGFDPARAALDQSTDAVRARHARHGYVIGADTQATPSVANLNGLVAQFAVSQLLALINGGQFAEWDYLHFDWFTGRTIPARTSRHDACPVCGPSGCLSAGDSPYISGLMPIMISPFKRRPLNEPQPTERQPSRQESEYSLPDAWHPDPLTP